jgi:hypothetical protein
MRQKSGTPKPTADRVVRDIRRKTRKHHSTEEKIRIVLSGLPGRLLQRQRSFVFAARRATGAGLPVAPALGLWRCGCVGHSVEPFWGYFGVL